MGTIISKAANGVGVIVGNAFIAPFKTIFGKSCESVCSGTWDIICFIENLCISDLVKLLMVFGLTYLTLLFFYLLFKVGIIQCIGRNLCKMTWAACRAYWHGVEHISCFLWYKLKNVKREYRGRRFLDIEVGSTSSYEGGERRHMAIDFARKRKPMRERRKDWMHRSLYPVNLSSKGIRYRSRTRSHPHVKWKTKEVSVLVNGSGRRNSRHVRVRHAARRRHLGSVKKRKRFSR